MINVLVVDDSSFMREVIRSIINKEPDMKVVGEGDNGEVGFEMYKELNPDIVTLDIVMEKANGITALQNIVDYDKNAAVIMVSSVGQEKYIKQCLEIGAKWFILKPFSEEDVIGTIRRMYARKENK